MTLLNPYSGANFFEFFGTLLARLVQGLVQLFGPSGAPLELASDELQMIVLLLIAISSALLGSFLVLRRMTMLANALSHTILPGIVIAYLLYSYLMHPEVGFDFSHLLPSDWWLIVAGIISGLLTTLLTTTCISRLGLAADASIGMVFTFLFAVGIILVTLFTKSTHVGAELLMGNVDALQLNDLTLIFWIFIANAIFIFLSWRALFVSSFDPLFATQCRVSNQLMSYLIMTFVAITAIGAFRAVGVLLYLAFLVTPALIARLFTHSLKKLVLLATLTASLCSIAAVALSRHLVTVYALPCSTSSIVVTLLAIVYAIATIKRTSRLFSSSSA